MHLRVKWETIYQIKICIQRKKEALYSTYNALEQEDLEEKISRVEAAHESQKYGLSWQLINSISGRKSCQTAKIHVENGETRQQAWFSHFSNLLGNPPQLLADEEEEAIHAIFHNHLIKFLTTTFYSNCEKTYRNCINLLMHRT